MGDEGVRIIPTNANDFATVVSECSCHSVLCVAYICAALSIGEVTGGKSV